MNKCVRVCFADFIISHGNEIILSKLFHFHRIFKNGGRGGCLSDPPEPHLDPPLIWQSVAEVFFTSHFSCRTSHKA